MAIETKVITDNIMKLYLYADMCKMIHYSTNKMHEHQLADDVRNDILDFADELAEKCFGFGEKPKFSDFSLNHKIKTSKDISGLCNNVLKLVENLRPEFEKDNMHGIVSIIDDFMGKLSQNIYLATFDKVSDEKVRRSVNEVLKRYF